MNFKLSKADKRKYGRPLILAVQQPGTILHVETTRYRQFEIFLNGRLVTQPFFANLKKGLVRRYRDDFKLDKHRKRILTESLHGKIEVRVKSV
jgi:hypothetical protein